ncbi:MAG TPA: hypothetical protein VML75_19180 [Kofleriaceae bacterium]|nr:hypothetical protein [Kofleriaceae bacterium]
MRGYVFSELTPVDRLVAPATLELLAVRRLQLYAAITPRERARAGEIVAACRAAGVTVGLWPMLADADGRWASAWNGVAFAAYVRDLLDELDARALRPDEVLVDLEPPIALTRRLLRGRPAAFGPPPRIGARALRGLIAELSHAGVPVAATVHPWAVCGPGRRGWQRAMGTPVEGVPFRRVFAMAYTSLIEGYSRGLCQRCDAEALLARWSAELDARLGDSAGIALGAIGIGALGDERCYRAPGELARDAAIARGAGARHLALFDLTGALDRPPAARWLDAFVEPAATESVAGPRVRVRATLQVIGGAGLLLDRLLRAR